MSILSQASKPEPRAVIATICGDSGIGKTSLAATFPKPIVIRGEDGLQGIPVEIMPDALPIIESSDQLWEQLNALIGEPHEYKTLIIDSVTALERLFIQEVMKIPVNGKLPRSINQALGGYGAGAGSVANSHQRVRKAIGLLNEKRNMNVVFIAHADTETIELPDQDPYTRYCLRLGKKSMAPYVDDCDLVGFLKLRTFTKGDGEKKKAISDGQRVLVTYTVAANVSKNRYGIEEDLIIGKGENPLIDLIPGINN